MGTVLLATDGSEYARRAAEWAIDLAADRETTLHVLSVVDEQRFNDPALSSAELATIYADENAAVSVEEVRSLADGRDVPVEGDVRRGVPADVIIEYAGEVDADVIVVGEHGDHDEHFSGVGQKVVERSEYDVVVVEPDRSPAE